MKIVDSLNSRYLVFSEREGAIRISVDRALHRHVNLRRRRRTVLSLMRKRIRFIADAIPSEQAILVQGPLASDTQKYLIGYVRDIDRLLDGMACEPMGPALVEKVLGISAKERLHWSQDGRLTCCGRALLNHQQIVSFPTYAAERIDEVLANPQLITVWREQDRLDNRA